jgi:hypothetical protein
MLDFHRGVPYFRMCLRSRTISAGQRTLAEFYMRYTAHVVCEDRSHVTCSIRIVLVTRTPFPSFWVGWTPNWIADNRYIYNMRNCFSYIETGQETRRNYLGCVSTFFVCTCYRPMGSSVLYCNYIILHQRLKASLKPRSGVVLEVSVRNVNWLWNSVLFVYQSISPTIWPYYLAWHEDL